ncbi:TauD/TfdA dioxygenase family protein [Novosphingobium malaysiense]|uniref:TauD/TfdA dioxygenase family protein n=1 Tax=Novosphingobium malaysiense TaxID=1348853 RepID=UPI000691253C|nr:TauD/TfdA family dioxygenase [Novosphingobium malaysiense]
MATVTEAGLKTRDIKPNIASEVLNSKEELLTGRYSAEIRDLLEQRGVIVFPGIAFTDEEQVAFTRTLGSTARERTGEEVFTVSLDPEKSTGVEYLKGAFYWHFDGVIQAKPILASLLSAKVLPPSGGDTEFCNTYAAYDALSDEDKQRFADLRVIHSNWAPLLYHTPEPSQEQLDLFASFGEIELPLVWTHKSGRKSLVLGCTATQVVGMDRKDSTLLLNRLREWATSEPFHYSHKWSAGDMVMWDNTGTLHRATPYPLNSGREMHRTKLEGEEPIAA